MLVGTTSPFLFGTFTLYEGRSSYTMQQAEIQNYFGELRTDIEAVSYGFYFLEFAEYVTRENNDETEIFKASLPDDADCRQEKHFSFADPMHFRAEDDLS